MKIISKFNFNLFCYQCSKVFWKFYYKRDASDTKESSRQHQLSIFHAHSSLLVTSPCLLVGFSTGTYGNKLDDTVLPSASSTQPTNAVFDGCRYNFLPWENKKPCIAVECFWEDIMFRLDTINMLMGMVALMVCHIMSLYSFYCKHCSH